MDFEISRIQNDRMIQNYNEDLNAIVDNWNSYEVEKKDFSYCIEEGLKVVRKKLCKIWVANASIAQGVFSSEIQEYIKQYVFPTFHKAGIIFFVDVKATNVLTSFSVTNYTLKLKKNAINLIEVKRFDQIKEQIQKYES